MNSLCARPGFALVLATLAVVVAGALIVATHTVVNLEHRVASASRDRQRAFAASEYGLWTSVETWSESNAALPIGGAATTIVRVLADSAIVRIVRLNEQLYWIAAEVAVGSARRSTGLNVRVTSDSGGWKVEPVRRSWVEVH